MEFIGAICNEIELSNSMIPHLQWVVVNQMMVMPYGHYIDREQDKGLTLKLKKHVQCLGNSHQPIF